MVCRKTDMPPKGPLDGVVIASGAVDQIEDLEVENEQTYYYAAWTFDFVGNFSPAVHGTATPRAFKLHMIQEGEGHAFMPVAGEVELEESSGSEAVSGGSDRTRLARESD